MNDAAKLKMSNKSVRKRFEQISRESHWSPGSSHLRLRKATEKMEHEKTEKQRARVDIRKGKEPRKLTTLERAECTDGPMQDGKLPSGRNGMVFRSDIESEEKHREVFHQNEYGSFFLLCLFSSRLHLPISTKRTRA